jgi:WD40 repeat protein
VIASPPDTIAIARIVDAATGKEIATLRDRTARIWDATTGKKVAIIRGHEREVTLAAFSPDGARIITGSGDQTARIWDAVTASSEDAVCTCSRSVMGTTRKSLRARITSAYWCAADTQADLPAD